MKRAFVVLATTMAVLLGMAQPAHAASGSLLYYTNEWKFIENPADGVCIDLEGLASVIENITNRQALLFSGYGCQGVPGVAVAGGPPITVTTVGSVYFTPL